MIILSESTKELSKEEKKLNPQILYHYTNRDGLLGMIKSLELWATDIHYLNDSSEYDLAKILFDERMSNIINDIKLEITQNMIKKVWDNFVYESNPIYSFSLTTKGDQLSQWRAYGNCNNSLSVGFDAPLLSEYIFDQKFMKLEFIRYSKIEQTKMLDRLEKSLRTRLKSLDNHEVISHFFAEFCHVGAFIKHRAFYEEREWRIIVNSKGLHSENICFRTGKNFLIPFYPISIGEHLKDLIKKVIVGPSHHSSLEIEAWKRFFDSQNIDVLVTESTIPYRT